MDRKQTPDWAERSIYLIAVATVIGWVGNFEQKISKTGNVYVEFSLAHNYGFGETQKTDWYRCVAFDNTAQRLIKAKVTKGSFIQVVGAQVFERYEKVDGSTGSAVKITLYDWSYVAAGRKSSSADDGNRPVDGRDMPL